MESFKIDPTQLLSEVKQLLREGNVRRIVIKQGDHTVVEFPLTVGVVGVALAPTLAAVGAIAALITDCSIEIERTDEAAAPPDAAPAPEAAATVPTADAAPAKSE